VISLLPRRAAETVEDNPLWLIVLADMMTNLMLFFLVMFAITLRVRGTGVKTFAAADVVDTAHRAEAAAARDWGRGPEELRGLFPDTSVSEHEIRVRLKNQILFPSAMAALSPAAAEPIAKLARVLKDMTNTVVIEGHTDNVRLSKSPYQSNWELSVARSESVIEELVRDGVPPERLVASGYGEFRPAAPNDSDENRARNRRVEVVILRAGGGTDE
jgi:flagellar motor protein MotB